VGFIEGLLIGGLAALACLFALWRMAQDHSAYLVTLQRLQRTLTQEQFQMSLNRMLRVANSSFDAIFVLDAERRITMLNDVAQQVFGITRQITGQTFMSVVRHHHLDQLAAQVTLNQEPLEDQIEIDGRTYKVRMSWIDVQTLVVALQDVTELLRLTRARRDMVANISHELRTPISSIRLMVDTLTQNYGKNLEKDLTKLARIDRETESLQFLVEELHDLSMIETGRAIMRMIETPLNLVIRDALSRMSSQLESRPLTIENTIPDSLIVLADPDQTRRVLTNLISNSLKFTAPGGRITFAAEANESTATIRMSDTGIGIPPSERKRIFERFFQVDSARSGNSSGSGLGLAIAKHIIEAQGGTIRAEAGELQGTTIVFTLSVAGAQS